MTLTELVGLLGPQPVLLPCNPGTKKPRINWKNTTFEHTQTPEYQEALFHVGNNVGVVQGGPGGGLCSIDLDTDEAAEEFKAKNPWASNTLITRGARGCNIWVRFSAGFPDKIRKVEGVGEYRAKGGQTIVWGKHPSGCDYSILQPLPVTTLRYEEIDWPESWKKGAGGTRKGAGRPPTDFSVFWESVANRAIRRQATEELLGEVRWEDSKGYFTCPNAAQHTVDGGQKEAVVFLDGTPNIVCSHSHCAESNESLTSILRDQIADRETIVFRPGMTFEAHARLFQAMREAKNFLYRDGIVNYERENHSLTPITRQTFREAISGAGIRLTKSQGGKIIPYEPKVPALEEMIMSPFAAKLLPPVTALPCTPVPLLNGDFRVLQPGYDSDTGILVLGTRGVDPGIPFEEAVTALREILSVWTFASDEDLARAFAAIVTPALHFAGALGPNVPLWVLVADKHGAGKSELQKLVASIYNAVVKEITYKPTGISSMEEAVNHQLRQGVSFIQIDNVRGKVDSQFLEALLTSRGGVSMRGAYERMQTVGNYRYVPMLNGNQGFVMTDDLASRSYITRIVAEDGRDWTFKDGMEIREYVPLHAPFYLGCVFSILEKWHSSGCTKGTVKRVRFGTWEQAVGGLATMCGFGDPIKGMLESHKKISSPDLPWLNEVFETAAEAREEWFNTDPATIVSPAAIWGLCSEFFVYPSVEIKNEKSGQTQVGSVLKSLIKTFGSPIRIPCGFLHSVTYTDATRNYRTGYVFAREEVAPKNKRLWEQKTLLGV